MRLKRLGWALAVPGVLVSALLLASCSSGGDSKGDAKDNAKPAATKAASDGGKAQTVAVTLKDNVFDPKEITVEKGTVTFEVKNTGAAMHNMHIMSSSAEGKDFTSKPTLDPGASDKFTAIFTKAGTIKFQCDFHLPDMAGTITVK
ncbi:MAG: hypothetical protein EPO16_09135 [Dehalococcoidia bacterium]|nr:MAG: hypothetical protein EPO16_09135 [Dehalococcoidia bacterium]